MRSARVVTENANGEFYTRRQRSENSNLRYVVIACIMLNNLWIERNDPLEPRWRLQVNELELFEKPLKLNVDINESNFNRTKFPIGYG